MFSMLYLYKYYKSKYFSNVWKRAMQISKNAHNFLKILIYVVSWYNKSKKKAAVWWEDWEMWSQKYQEERNAKKLLTGNEWCSSD